jgi:uncharacterized protein
MALALRKEPAETAAEIIEELRQARTLPEHALRRAVEFASEIETPVIALANRAADGAFLLPRDENQLFWGIHALAAARCVRLYRPLLRLVQLERESHLDRLLGDGVTITLGKVVISIFDGDPLPLVEACSSREVDSCVRWSLMKALARLTFDGKVARSVALEFLVRFERESLAEPDDPAWEGWQDMIVLLGAEEMREPMHASWRDGRNLTEKGDREYFDKQLTVAQSLAPGDASMFDRENAVPIDDVVETLSWTAPRKNDRRQETNNDLDDPGGVVALQLDEIYWLRDFLCSGNMYVGTMSFEQIDGYFCALIAGPSGASLERYLPHIWSPGRDVTPTFDDEAQSEYVHGLLARHWTCISQRLDAGYLHIPKFKTYEEMPGWEWAIGFDYGVTLRTEEWRFRRGEPNIGKLVDAVTGLAMDRAEAKSIGFSPVLRERLVAALPKLLVSLHHAWRGREDPFQRTVRMAPARKIGRNEPCFCGSGKKFKRCCGTPDKLAVH